MYSGRDVSWKYSPTGTWAARGSFGGCPALGLHRRYPSSALWAAIAGVGCLAHSLIRHPDFTPRHRRRLYYLPGHWGGLCSARQPKQRPQLPSLFTVWPNAQQSQGLRLVTEVDGQRAAAASVPS